MSRGNPIAMAADLVGRSDLATSDPYDVWATDLGFRVKKLYNRSAVAGVIPAALIQVFDTLINNDRRLGYRKREYPIVRAHAALCALALADASAGPELPLHEHAARHIERAVDLCTAVGGGGLGWGLGFDYAVAARFDYTPATPLTTMSAYVIEAMLGYRSRTGDDRFDHAIGRAFRFFLEAVPEMRSPDGLTAYAYSDAADRIVVNANAYMMLVASMGLRVSGLKFDASACEERLANSWHLVRQLQHPDGSWVYGLPPAGAFIDTFHSCIVLKNIVKADMLVGLDGSQEVVERGVRFLEQALRDEGSGLFGRFVGKRMLGLTRWDLYDQAEMIGLYRLLGREDEAGSLCERVLDRFFDCGTAWSMIDLLGVRRNCDHLRWAKAPALLAMVSPSTWCAVR